jgi:hypothetical protein
MYSEPTGEALQYEFAEQIRNTDKFFVFAYPEREALQILQSQQVTIFSRKRDRLQANCSPSLTRTTTPAFFW